MIRAQRPRKLKDGERRRYIARVQDAEGNHPKHGDDWFRVLTTANPKGEFKTRKAATDALERAKQTYRHGDLIGHVADIIVHIEPTLQTIDIHKWLLGDVKPISSVPAHLQDDYEDTLRRTALAAQRYGSPVWVNESFRSRAQQQHFYDIYLAGGPIAARPGTSPHEFGLALDIPNARNTPGFIREARALGMIDNVPSEPWHLENTKR